MLLGGVGTIPEYTAIFHFPHFGERLTDVANNTIIKMESGENKNPTLETLRKVAKVLDISVDELIN